MSMASARFGGWSTACGGDVSLSHPLHPFVRIFLVGDPTSKQRASLLWEGERVERDLNQTWVGLFPGLNIFPPLFGLKGGLNQTPFFGLTNPSERPCLECRSCFLVSIRACSLARYSLPFSL